MGNELADAARRGTPAGVGLGRNPRRFLRPGETLHSWIEGIGELSQVFVTQAVAQTTEA
jgi:2-keto-4-pentenoate hydratase/2-oxohepta-3-ene-1,7-dioic acid hydratase in catechol pathway